MTDRVDNMIQEPRHLALALKLIAGILLALFVGLAGWGVYTDITGVRFPFYAPKGTVDGITRVLEDPAPFSWEELEDAMDQVELEFPVKYRACTLLTIRYDPKLDPGEHDLVLQGTIYSGRYASRRDGILAPSSQFLWNWYLDRDETGQLVLAEETGTLIPDDTLGPVEQIPGIAS